MLVLVLMAALAGTPSESEPASFSYTEVDWTMTPTRGAVNSVYPAGALKRHIAGRATMICRAGAAGQLIGCKLTSEEPTGEGFGKAVLGTSHYFEMRPKTRDGRTIPVGAQITVPVRFSAFPSIMHPIQAAHPNLPDGRVTLDCRVTDDAHLTNCVIVDELPAGVGLADIAVKLSKRMTFGSAPKELFRVMLPIDFIHASQQPPPTERMDFVAEPLWLKRPESRDFAKVYPGAALQRHIDGRAILQCKIAEQGRLDQCVSVAESPSGEGFGAASLRITDRFQMRTDTHDEPPVVGRFVRIPVYFWASR